MTLGPRCWSQMQLYSSSPLDTTGEVYAVPGRRLTIVSWRRSGTALGSSLTAGHTANICQTLSADWLLCWA